MERQLLTAMLAGVALSCCTTHIIPPKSPQKPRQVFLLDHGLHSSLVLSRADGHLVRYSYGDWNYYALRKTGFWRAAAALLVSTTAGLGRQEFSGPSSADTVRRQLRVGVEQILSLKVEAQAVAQLQIELESIYTENRETLVHNSEFNANFVEHPRNYSLLHNSNWVVAAWLEALGCEIRGWPILSKWRLEAPADEQTQSNLPEGSRKR